MNRVRALIARLRGGHHPPTGPLTTSEQATADELQKHAVLDDSERTEHDHEHEHDEER